MQWETQLKNATQETSSNGTKFVCEELSQCPYSVNVLVGLNPYCTHDKLPAQQNSNSHTV